MNAIKNERIKYLIAAGVGFLLFFLGSLVYMYAIYGAASIKLDISFIDFYKGIADYSDPKAVAMLQYVSYVPFLIGIIFLLKDDIVEDLRKFKKEMGRNFAIIGIGFGALLAATFIISLVYYLLDDSGTSQNENIIVEILLSNGALPMIISVVILAPLAEELLFRKIFFGFFEKTLKCPPVVSIILSALVFSFIHVTDAESLKYIFQYLPLALIMCLAYHFSRNNIFVPIAIHLVNNLLSVITTYLGS